MKKTLIILFSLTLLLSGCSLWGGSDTTTENIPGDKKLDLSSQELKEVPTYVFKKTKIEELNLSGNEIPGTIPAEIKNLKHLRVLDLSDNVMTGLPAEIGQLEDLEFLDISNNGITGLPHELGNLQKLKWFKITGNRYSEQDLAIIEEQLPALTNIIR